MAEKRKRQVSKKKTAKKSSSDGTSSNQFFFNILDFIVSVLDVERGKFRAHAYAVAKYARLTATELGLKSDETDKIVLAAYLHDLDKLIHRKKKVRVVEILEHLKAPTDLQKTIRHVRERYDGKGKPDGLKGAKIPIGSRIIAAANMLDEISRGKVDTQVIKRDEAFKSLQKRVDSYLDKKVVEALIACLKRGKSNFYKEVDARVLLAMEEDDTRFIVANALLENGYTTYTTREEQDTFAALYDFFPHVVLISVPLFAKLVDACREADTVVRKPVLLIGKRGTESDVVANDFIPIEGFIAESAEPAVLLSAVEKLFSRVVDEEMKARENALFFEKAGNEFKAGNVYRELGDYRRAVEMYEIAGAYATAAEIYEILKDNRRAAKAYEMAGDYLRAAKLYGDAGLFEDRGRVYEKTGNYYYSAKNKLFQGKKSEALKLFERVQPGHEKYRKACYFVAKIHMEKKRWQQAIQLYDKVIDNEAPNTKNLRHHYNVAVATEQLKKYKDALEIYEKILGVDYNFRDVLKRVEHLRHKLKQLDQQTKMEHKVNDFVVAASLSDSTKTRYEKRTIAGRGGMGIVYDAIDLVLGRRVALKVLSATFRDDKFVVDTFLREAKAAAMLNHINIVTVYDAGIENNNYFIAMEMIEGETLKELLKKQQFSIAAALRIMRQVASGLKYAHSKKVIHRDLTNSNIMLTKDNLVKIMDFGLARIVEHLMSEQSIIGGTPSYMAPEQVQGAPIDHRADIYALGINLFELTTSRLPFVEGDLGYHHVHTAPPNPQEFNAKIPNELTKVILKCLEKDPAARFQSVDEFMQALKV